MTKARDRLARLLRRRAEECFGRPGLRKLLMRAARLVESGSPAASVAVVGALAGNLSVGQDVLVDFRDSDVVR